MVTLLRPHRHAHGPDAVTVRLISRSRSQQQSSSSSPPLRRPCRPCSRTLSSMAQDPSHPHRHSKDTASPPPQQPEQPEIAQQQPAPEQPPPPPPPPREEASSSSSSGSDAGGASWLQLGLGPSPTSSSSSRQKRRRTTTDEAGPSTSVQPAAAPPPQQQPQLQLSLEPGPSSSSAPAGAVVAAAPPPLRHESGTWFLLQAAQNQRREPPLPQIPRSYLRVRDGRMTVRVVMRYLVNKLGLEDDSQLEITCRGQRLPPTMTLQQVRDTIWRPVPAEAVAVIPAPGSPSTNQIMTLYYGRS